MTNAAHSSMTDRRFSRWSVRRYAAFALPFTMCARQASATSSGVSVASAHQSRKLDLNPCIVNDNPARRSCIVNVTFDIGRPALAPGNTRALRAVVTRYSFISSNIARHRSANGILCGRSIFMRSFGIVQSRSSISNSDQTAPRPSPVLVAVRMMNSIARRETSFAPSISGIRATNFGTSAQGSAS